MITVRRFIDAVHRVCESNELHLTTIRYNNKNYVFKTNYDKRMLKGIARAFRIRDHYTYMRIVLYLVKREHRTIIKTRKRNTP